MKRMLSILTVILLLSAALCAHASASDFQSVAEDLSAVGMFRGTANGFELDRAPTRSEAAIMLVRLYGAEEAAKASYAAGEISHPFTDVSDFTSPYVAWLYTNGITNGYSKTTYASQRTCSLQNYVVFLLRALGYKDDTDFRYAEALSFAQSKGFYDPVMFSGEFLRDDLAALTYQALAADMANGKTCLLESLISIGAVDAKAASPFREKIKLYRALTSAMAVTEKGAMDIDIASTINMSSNIAGETVNTCANVTSSMQIKTNESDIQLAYSTTTSSNGILTSRYLWMKDGWVYSYDDDGTMIKYHPENQAAAFNLIKPSDYDALNINGLALVDSISAKRSGPNMLYSVVINQHLGGLEYITDGQATRFSPVSIVYTVDSRGRLVSANMVYSADITMEMPLAEGFSEQLQVHCAYETAMKIKSTGSKVKISWPDFSGAVEVSNQ